MPIEEASAKIRAAGPADDTEDLSLPIWAGQMPLVPRFAPPVGATDLPEGIDVSPAVARLATGEARHG
jgi:hypothetical protein